MGNPVKCMTVLIAWLAAGLVGPVVAQTVPSSFQGDVPAPVVPQPSASREAVAPVMPSLPAAAQTAPAVSNEQVQTEADHVQYDRVSGWITAHGHVKVRKGPDVLEADLIRINMATEEAQAIGNVVLRRPGQVWQGKEGSYNFRTRLFLGEGVAVTADPFRCEARQIERTEQMHYQLRDAWVTTCTNPMHRAHWRVHARSVTVVPDDHLTGRGAVWYFGPVPCFYFPRWYRSLSDDYGYRFRPGHDSRWGAYLLSSVWYRMAPGFKGETHLDWRTRRGVAVGQDFNWWEPGERSWSGGVSGYYAQDQEPEDETDEPGSIDPGRYRIRLKQDMQITDVDRLYLRGEYVSDRDVRQDFFESDFRQSAVPENYFVYSHRGTHYSLGMLAQVRVNDYFETVDRLPQFTATFLRQVIPGTPFYYDGFADAVFLQRRRASTDPGDEPSTFRFDTQHRVYYPNTYFRFLSLVPRAGVRETYYSASRDVRTEVTTVWVTNLLAGTTNQFTRIQETRTQTVEGEGGAVLRSMMEFGADVSFKAYATWGGAERPRRHVVEPYLNYTLIPEPSVTPDELYAFDGVDSLDEQHNVRLGVRNKYQAKREGLPVDLADVNLYTVGNLNREEGQDLFTHVTLDADLRPTPSVTIYLDGSYNLQEAAWDSFNTRLGYKGDSWWSAGLEHRLLREDSSLLTMDLLLFEGREWAYNLFGRYEFETARFEEQGGYIQRNYDCLSVRSGFRFLPGYVQSDGIERDDEYRVQLEFWLSAFPEVGLRGRAMQ